MSGHSHWSTIKRKKALQDARRGELFSKLSRGIAVAVAKGGEDPSANVALRRAIDEARFFNMPKENIKRAIEKGKGASKEHLEEVILEGYGPGGVAFLVHCLTGNRNRTISEVRNTFSRYGGSLGERRSTAYIFAKDKDNPQFLIPITEKEQAKKVLNLAQALEDLDDVQEVYANFDVPDEFITNNY